MVRKLNCWEILCCGREINGANAKELGVCHASTETSADGVNGGINGGRICWSIAGTFGKGEMGTFAEMNPSCMSCEVFRTVQNEETWDKFRLTIPENNTKRPGSQNRQRKK